MPPVRLTLEALRVPKRLQLRPQANQDVGNAPRHETRFREGHLAGKDHSRLSKVVARSPVQQQAVLQSAIPADGHLWHDARDIL